MAKKTTHTTRPRKQDVEMMSVSIKETQAFGERIGRLLRAGDVVAFYGELGSGKTTLIQGIAQGCGVDPDVVKSPTFVLHREYPASIPIIHVDGYRLEGAQAVAWLDLDLIFSAHKITLIEWAERFEGLLPEHVVEVRLSHVSTNRRRIALQATGPRREALIESLRTSTPVPEPPERDDGTPGD